MRGEPRKGRDLGKVIRSREISAIFQHGSDAEKQEPETRMLLMQLSRHLHPQHGSLFLAETKDATNDKRVLGDSKPTAFIRTIGHSSAGELEIVAVEGLANGRSRWRRPHCY